MLNNLYLNFNIHFLNFIRNKNAFFWAMAFPLFLFLVFYTIFNGFSEEGYATFLLTGVLGMTITADGIFGVGAIIQQNYRNGTIRIIKKMPVNILVYFLGMIINRVLILISLLVCLNICTFILAGKYIEFGRIPSVILGIFIGMWIFSFLGLSLSFMNLKTDSEKGIKNLIYFLILFSSNALYMMSSFNIRVEKFADYMPLNGVLRILRSEPTSWLNVVVWMIVPSILFYIFFNKVQYQR